MRMQETVLNLVEYIHKKAKNDTATEVKHCRQSFR